MLLPLLLLALASFDEEAEYGEFQALTTVIEGTVPAQWRVIWTEDPAHRAVVGWTTAEEGASHAVHWGVESCSDDGVYANVVPATRNGRYTASQAEQGVGLETPYFHHVRLSDLPADTTIWFRIVSDGVASRELHFRTDDPDARESVFLAGGDSRSGHMNRCRMNVLIGELADEDPALLAFSHGGDYVFDGNLWSHWTLWLSQFELTTSEEGRVLPIIPVRGNHDVGPLYGQAFDEPGAPRANYWTTRVGSVALVNLNTEISAAGEQATWLDAELRARRADSRWLIPNYHRALYPAVKEPAGAKAHWVPLFDQHKADLVLESDGHVFKRTVPILEDRADPRGTVYIGEGGLGVEQRKPRNRLWYLQDGGRAASAHHVMRIAAREDALHVRTIGLGSMAIEFEPEELEPVLARGALAAYRVTPDPEPAWVGPGYDDTNWQRGRGGFGFGDGDDETVLDWMHHAYDRLYLRYQLNGAELLAGETLGLAARFDDGFVAFLNGTEVARGGVEAGRGAEATGIANHEATRWEHFAFDDWRRLVLEGTNVFAVEGHNRGKHSNDFTLDVTLVRGTPEKPSEPTDAWILDETTIRPFAERWKQD